ncbi:MAG: hypothetical protein KIT58_04980 [Planctomycetota bacterium]|nr:hypothetical protein [Planctomycetota bacterium]
MATTTAAASPSMTCACGATVDLTGRRVGDSVRCGGCQRLRVVLRSQVKGEVPPAARTGGLSADERHEVAQALKRIKVRRAGAARGQVELYPSWAVFVAGVQFYLSAILAGQNLAALGEPQRGRRLQVIGVVCYLLSGAALLFAYLRLSPPQPVLYGLLAGVPLLFAIWFTAAQHAPATVAREHGARSAGLALPALVGIILAIAQAFTVYFLMRAVYGPHMGMM